MCPAPGHAIVAALALLAEKVLVKIAPVAEVAFLFGPRQRHIVSLEVSG